MDEEEKITEINIVLDRPLVIALLMIIIVLEASYIGYLRFFQTTEAGKSSGAFGERKTIDEVKETEKSSLDYNNSTIFVPKPESDYWDHEYIEIYRGYEIYYFKNINIYGIDTGEPEPVNWIFIGSVETAKGKIDNWFEEPEEIEIFHMWKIYRQASGKRFFWAEHMNTGDITTLWVDLDDLKEYIEEIA